MKVGFDQFDKAEPKSYKRFLGAIVIFIVPATGTFITSLPQEVLQDTAKVTIGLAVTWTVAVLYAIGFFLGDSSESK